MNKATSRRALLHVGALSGVVAASGLVVPALARDTKKTGAEETISPPEDLMREHAVLDRILLVYEAGMRRASQGEDIDPAVFEHSAGIVRDFIHDYHEKSEEELIFPRFKTAGRMVELVNVLVVQHGAGRKLTERILAAAPQTRNREPREAMGRDIQAFIAMYRPHAAREETDLFPTLRQLVTSGRIRRHRRRDGKARTPGVRRRRFREDRQEGRRDRNCDRHSRPRRVHAEELMPGARHSSGAVIFAIDEDARLESRAPA